MNIKILYEDADVIAADKPAGIVVFQERMNEENAPPTLIDYLIAKKPEFQSAGVAPRYGIAHRLDKGTSGILLVAKHTESLIFLQKQFNNRRVEKRYTALATGTIKEDSGTIETLIGRSPQDPRKQKAYPMGVKNSELKVKRKAITEYKVLQRFADYTLLEISTKTGRKHQIRCHLAYIHHPIAGDTFYGFKDSLVPEGLQRQFLHASYLKIPMPNGQMKEFHSPLPKELMHILETL